MKRILITGAASGIGLATARAFLEAGARVALGDLDGPLAEQVADDLGPRASGHGLDVTDAGSFAAFLDAAVATHGTPVDVLVNNAGIMPNGAFVEQSERVDRATMDVNVFGVITGMRLVLPEMVERGRGHVVNVASLAGKVPLRGLAVYNASKFAVVGLTAATRLEMESSGVSVTAVLPSAVRTELSSGIDLGVLPTVDPEDIARAADAAGNARSLLVNTPNNPTGVVYTRKTLEGIAEICTDKGLWLLSDEVYDTQVWNGDHLSPRALPGMAERTLTISSGGKSFGFTGWKIGWANGPADMVSAVLTAKQSLTYVSGGPFQHAMVTALGLDDGYFSQLADDLEGKRDLLGDGLRSAGFEVFPTAGTYFVTADIRPLGFDDGVAFCMSMPERCGVVAVPSAVFYDDGEAGRHLIRFAFCKQPEILVEASRRLAGMAGSGS